MQLCKQSLSMSFMLLQWGTFRQTGHLSSSQEVVRLVRHEDRCGELCTTVLAKHENCKIPGLLQPLPIPSSAWQDISLDFIEGLPNSEGYSIIFVVVDRFTKYAHFIALRHPYTTASVANVFIQHIARLHGIPRSIVSSVYQFLMAGAIQRLEDNIGDKYCLPPTNRWPD